jgi:hypothetical protein
MGVTKYNKISLLSSVYLDLETVERYNQYIYKTQDLNVL